MSKQNKHRTAEENIFLRELRQLFITDLFELYIEAKTGKKIDGNMNNETIESYEY